MLARDFCFWLQGYMEISTHSTPGLTAHQLEIVKKHLNLVFLHDIDPSMGDKKHQEELNTAHSVIHSSKPMGDMIVRC